MEKTFNTELVEYVVICLGEPSQFEIEPERKTFFGTYPKSVTLDGRVFMAYSDFETAYGDEYVIRADGRLWRKPCVSVRFASGKTTCMYFGSDAEAVEARDHFREAMAHKVTIPE